VSYGVPRVQQSSTSSKAQKTLSIAGGRWLSEKGSKREGKPQTTIDATKRKAEIREWRWGEFFPEEEESRSKRVLTKQGVSRCVVRIRFVSPRKPNKGGINREL